MVILEAVELHKRYPVRGTDEPRAVEVRAGHLVSCHVVARESASPSPAS
jgi:hypothetical protein